MASKFPTYTIPEGMVTEDGWYDVSLGKEPIESCRARATAVAAEMRKRANAVVAPAESDEIFTHNVVMVIHHDFKCALLDAFLLPETTGPLRRWTCYNASMTTLDIYSNGTVNILQVNSVTHLPKDLVEIQDLGKR